MTNDRFAQTTLTSGILFVATLIASGCGGSSGSGGGSSAADTGEALTTYVGFRRINQSTSFPNQPEFSSVLRGDKNFAQQFEVISNIQDGSHGGMVLDYFGTLYAADLDEAFSDNKTGISINWSQRLRTLESSTGTFAAGYDRRITGFNTGFVEPRSIAMAHAAGLLFVADSGAADIKVYGAAATGNVAPFFTAESDAGTPVAPWDVAYDETNDRLFASLMDGTIAVFDSFVATQPAVADRIIVPSADGTTQGTVSLRGIALDPEPMNDRLVFTDVGVVDGGADGVLGAIDSASTATGLTSASLLPAGSSGLEDPVDVVVTADGRLRVADLQSNRVLIFGAGVLDGAMPLPAATAQLTRSIERPLAIAVEPAEPVRTVGPVGDLEDPATPLAGLVVTVDPGASDGAVQLFDPALTGGAIRDLDFGASVRGVTVDSQGDAYICTSSPGPIGAPVGSVGVVNRFVTQRGTGADLAFDTSRDRLLQIFPGVFVPVPALIDPADVDVDETRDLVIVSDPGFPRIWMFGRGAGMSAEAVQFTDDGFVAGTALPGGLDYDSPTDRLFVAVSNGTIYVYDSFVETPGTMPDRVITPADALGTTQISTSISEVLYDATNDVLFAAELGGTSGVSNDGAIYIFEGASTAGGLASATRVISGAATGLDDPTEFAWNGSTLWVADTANETLARFDDALTLDGNAAPDASLAVPNIRGVEVAPAAVGPASGGSISDN